MIMSLGTKLVQAVQKEAAMKRPLPLRSVAQDSARSGRAEASVTLTDNDRFSHMAEEVKIQVQTPKPKVQSPKSVAERFVARATYLTEALQFVEMDAGGTAVVRSTPATMRAPRS